mmetsp:Transcript_14923/g.26560  ORF Transcript_14923/g.26560 Transcript_14923/m.26560 type:complete len:311 (+) Transcript_14923:65-997(+)
MKNVGHRWVGTKAEATSKRTGGGLLVLVDLVLTVATLTISTGIIFGLAALTDLGIVNKELCMVSLSIVCPLVTMTQFMSPFPVVVDAVRKVDGKDLPLPVFQSQIVCNILGLSYAIQVHNTSILCCNLWGLAAQILFLSSARFANQTKGAWLIYGMQMTVVLNVGLYFFAAILPMTLLGHLITLFNIVLFASPLAKLGDVLRTRSAASLPVAIIAVTFVSNGLWTMFGILIEDQVVLLPSLLGFMLSTFQVLLILWCHHKLPFDLAFLLLPWGNKAQSSQDMEIEAVKIGLAGDRWAEPDWDNQDWEQKS